jgi:3-aminobutyryl-CoA ammonia-lyase
VAVVDIEQANGTECTLRVRFGTQDNPYPGGIIPGAVIIRNMADASAELGIRVDGMGGLLACVKEANFLKPVYVGDYVQVRAVLTRKGNRSRYVSVAVTREIERRENAGGDVVHEIHEPPEVVAEATLVSVRPW